MSKKKQKRDALELPAFDFEATASCEARSTRAMLCTFAFATEFADRSLFPEANPENACAQNGHSRMIASGPAALVAARMHASLHPCPVWSRVKFESSSFQSRSF
jgi:hypothetical protein